MTSMLPSPLAIPFNVVLTGVVKHIPFLIVTLQPVSINDNQEYLVISSKLHLPVK
jgi:hypothetical protein